MIIIAQNEDWSDRKTKEDVVDICKITETIKKDCVRSLDVDEELRWKGLIDSYYS